jgi:hypothetical protein
MASPPYNASLEQMAFVERLLKATKPERWTYLIMTGISVGVLLVCAGVLLVKSQADLKVLGGLFGSTGIVTYSSGQILRIWTDAMRLVAPKA